MLTNRPAMKFCLPLFLGIVLGWNMPGLSDHLPILFIVQVTLFLLSAIFLRGSNYRSVAVFCTITLFGMMKILFDTGAGDLGDVDRYIDGERHYRIIGTITDLPSRTDRMVKFGIETVRLEYHDTVLEVTGTIQISVPLNHCPGNRVDSLMYGEQICVNGILSEPTGRRNPGDFDMIGYYKLNGISARCTADSIALLAVKKGFDLLALFVYPVRHAASLALDSIIGGEEGDFLKGLLLGERSNIPLEVKNEFVNAGVMHILAVSGLHVAIVAMILIIFFQIIRLPEKIAIIATLLTLCYYNFLTGSTASVTRSVIMASVFLGGKLLERKPDIYNTLAVSAMIIVLIDAKQFFQAGFQLSFAAVISLVYLYPKVYGTVSILPVRLRDNPAMKILLAGFSVSVAAGLGTLPFTAYYFGKISVISFVANLVAVPLSNVILAVGMLAVAVWFITPWFGIIYANATKILTFIFLRIVALFGNLSFAYVPARFTIVSSVVFYGIAGLLFGLSKPRRGKYCLIGLLLSADLFVWQPVLLPGKSVLRVSAIDVGQGDAIWIEFPNNQTLLIDCGPKTSVTDAGARFIEPFLRWNLRGKVDAVLLTHSHADHIGGLPYLLRNIQIGRVCDSGTPLQTGLDSEYHRLADSLRLEHDTLRQGMIIPVDQSIRCYVLYPRAELLRSLNGHHVNLNNQSVVLKIIYGGTSILLTGDAEEEVEQLLIGRYGNFLQSDILKAGHHGSITSSSQDFLNFVRPSSALISVGVKNKFRHPSPVVLHRLNALGCRYYRTDENGAVVFESDGMSWKKIDWK